MEHEAYMREALRLAREAAASRQDFSASFACAIASISAWDEVRCNSSRRLRPRPMILPSLTMTQPTMGLGST